MKKQVDDPLRAHKAGRRVKVAGALVALLVIGGVAAAYAVRGGLGAPKPKDKPPPTVLEFTPAEVVQPALSRMPLAVEFSGPLVAPRTAIVRAKAAGTLLALGVAEGNRVKAGQVIGQIDLADLQSRVAERAAMVESAQASLLEAERQHTANVDLAAQNFISATALQTSQARLDAARAQLKSVQAQLSASRINVREATLAVPISGIVGKRHVVPGEKVSAEQPIVTVVDLSTLELAGTVGTNEISLLEAGQKVAVRVEGSDKVVAGRIDRIAPAAEAGTRAIGVVVVLANHDERFRAGQYAQARVELADATPRLNVPQTAVGQASGQDFVWMLDQGALVRRLVITGRRDPESGRVEITRGLDPANQILAMRFDNLKEGAGARIVARRSAAGASSASAATETKAAATPRS
ncbi:MAG: efflux RND transporter periplasmic adaptor subunit [Caldimonas sp.]